MLTFAAICPHPPILIPTIGQENLEKIKQTVKALEELKKSLEEAKPDSIIIISPHGALLADAFTLNLAPKYVASYEDFGEFSTKLNFSPDQQLLSQIRDQANPLLPIVMISNEKLDHGSSVPLFYLTKNLPNIQIVPVGYSLLDFQTHFKFGQLIAEEIKKINKRVAVIASGDLSHRLTPDAPAGFNPKGKEFDEKLINLLKNSDVENILTMENELIEEAGECGLRSFIILLGILSDKKFRFTDLSYEGPFGVGYLVGKFDW